MTLTKRTIDYCVSLLWAFFVTLLCSGFLISATPGMLNKLTKSNTRAYVQIRGFHRDEDVRTNWSIVATLGHLDLTDKSLETMLQELMPAI